MSRHSAGIASACSSLALAYCSENSGYLLSQRKTVEHSKSIAFADTFLKYCDDGDRLCCAREFQNSIDDSVHSLLKSRIYDLQGPNPSKHSLFASAQKINSRNGRDHYPRVWSGLLAGGSVKSGYVYGSSDAKGAAVKDNPVRPGDIHATMFDLLGVNYKKENYSPQGRPI